MGQSVFINRIRYKQNKFNDIAKDSLDEWIYFLKDEEIKEGLKQVKEALGVMKLSEQEHRGSV